MSLYFPVEHYAPTALGLAFRQTVSYVQDAPGDIFGSRTHPYITNFGVIGKTTAIGNTRDRLASVDPRLAGIHFNANGITPGEYLWDVAPGIYELRFAGGDATSGQGSQKIEFFNDQQRVGGYHKTGGMAGGEYWDAAGVLHTSEESWIATNNPVIVDISSGRFRIKYGDPDAGSGNTVMAYVSLRRIDTVWYKIGAAGGDASKTTADSGSGAEQVALAAGVPLAESGSGSDSSIALAVSAALADAGAGADSISTAVLFVLGDSGAGVDASGISIMLPLADSVSGADSSTIGATLPLADSGTASDIETIAALLALADSGSGGDVLDLLTGQLVEIADAGSGAEAVALNVSVTLAASAAGSDATEILVAVTAADSVSASDSVSVDFLFDLADTAAAVEQALVSVAVQLGDSGSALEQISIPQLAQKIAVVVKARQRALSRRGKVLDNEAKARHYSTVVKSRKPN